MDCNVLLVEDSPDDAHLIGRALASNWEPKFTVERVSRLSEGLDRLSLGGIDVVLLDLSLPDSQGIQTFSALHAHIPQVPVVLLTGTDDEQLAIQAAQQGAQDYLVKGQIHRQLLARSILYAVERQRLLRQSEQQALENARLYQELEASREEMAVVDGVARILTSTLYIEQVYEQFALEVKKLVDFDRIYITVADHANEISSARYLFGVTHPDHFQDQHDGPSSEPDHQPANLDYSHELRPSTEGSHHEGKENLLDGEASSSIDVPLISHGRSIGSMGIRSCRVGAYSEREHTTLERLASQIAPAIENSELYKQVQSSIEEMAVVDEVAKVMTSTLEVHQVYEDFAREMKKLVDFERASINIIDRDAGVFVIKYAFGPPYPSRPVGTALPLEGTHTGYVASTGQTMVRHDLRESPSFQYDGENIDLGLNSSITVPLISKGQVFGSLLLRCPRENAYGHREQAILERLASQIAPALENARLYEDLQASIKEREVAAEVATIITSTLHIDEVYEKFAREVKRLVDFDRIVISVVEPHGDSYLIAYHYGVPMLDRSPGSRVPLEGTPVEQAIRSRQTLFRYYTRDSTDPANIRRLSSGLRSGITVPLIVGGEAVGTMTLHSCQSNIYGEHERVILERMASQIAPAIENARLYQETLYAQEALRESESRFRQLYDEAPVGYQEMDAEGRITRVNRTELEMLGYAAEEMLGQLASEFISEDGVIGPPFITDLVRVDSPMQEREFNFRRKDGSTIPTLVESRALLDESGHLAGFRCTIQDITERKQTEKRLQETNRLVSIGELAAGVAHEINNPLTSVLGFSQILLNESLPPPVIDDLQKIYYSAQRASKIVQNLLSFAKKREPERRLMDLLPVLERALDLKSFDFRGCNINVSCHLEEGLPPTLADEYQIIQVLMNILNNAQQAIEEADVAGQLVIRAYQANDGITISISDNGPGIPPENLGKVFQPFFTTKQVGTGTGLGLSICYGIIQQHEGDLWVESSPGEGTTFYIQLPMAEGIEESKKGVPEIRPSLSDIKHVLIVDDEPHIRDLLARSLSQLRYTVDLAEDGEEAWRKVQRRAYDCVIMDLKMPNMSGQELFGLIQEFKPTLAQKSIFMTGDMVTPETREFVASVNSPTLSKPFELKELCEHIQMLLDT